MKKICIIATDGVGLRNFLFTDFLDKANEKGYEVFFWNQTVYPISKNHDNCTEILPEVSINHPLTDLYQNSKTKIQLYLNYRKSNNKAYLSYIFPARILGLKSLLKQMIIKFFRLRFNSKKGILKINQNVEKLERKTRAYKLAIKTLKTFKPDFVLCTNQRIVKAISVLLAAEDLGIPTATFIFSWDNLPKATLVVNPDYYFVWSDYMRAELLNYYPRINESQIMVTGTPQFQPHYKKSNIQSKHEFYNEHGLDLSADYICFSGCDATTSPNDPYYLKDLAKSVSQLNSKGYSLGIVLRKSPVDKSDRFDFVVDLYRDVIKVIDPIWIKYGSNWSTMIPTAADFSLLANISKHCILAINVGSSMVFDFAIHDRPCAYLNYDTSLKFDRNWTISKIYKFIHFQSMPSHNQVYWINDISDFIKVIKDASQLEHPRTAKSWFELINNYPQNSSKEILNKIETILSKDV
jgi:hypothetical protein